MIKIVNFHVIGNRSEALWLEKIIGHLKASNALISSDQLLASKERLISSRKSYYMLTVDDGHKSFYKYIYPLALKYEAPIALFVSPSVIENRENFWFQKMQNFDKGAFKKYIANIKGWDQQQLVPLRVKSVLKCLEVEEIEGLIEGFRKAEGLVLPEPENIDKNQLEELQASGLVEIGAHTLRHPILKNESLESATREIRDSVVELSDLLGTRISRFAYPHGKPGLDFTQRDMEICEKAGLDIAFSTEFKTVDKSDSNWSMPRGEITKGKVDFRLKLALWSYWNKLDQWKNKDVETNQRIKFSARMNQIEK